MPQAWEDQWSAKEVGDAIRELRTHRRWTKVRLAREAGLAEDQIAAYEDGLVRASRKTLAQIAAAVDVPFDQVERYLLPLMKPLRTALEGPAPGEELLAELEGLIHRTSLAFSRMLRTFAMRLLVQAEAREGASGSLLGSRPPAADDLLAVAGLWEELVEIPQEERRKAVETRADFWHWAICARCCEASLQAAPDDADKAVKWAELAVVIAERADGDEQWLQRLLGWAIFHLSNAHRVHGDLTAADLAFARAQGHWAAGEGADVGEFLNPAQVFNFEASLRREQRRLPEAHALIDQALAIASGEIRPRLLTNKAKIFEEAGQHEQALAILAEARSLLTGQSEPRLARIVETNCVLLLCRLERYQEADALVPTVRQMTMTSGGELDRVRFRWIQGTVAAGLGWTQEALAHLEAVREEFIRREIPYDAALVTLEIAGLHLQEGRTAEVKRLACEVVAICQSNKVHREALAAVQLFREAAEREAVDQEAIRELLGYLQRAQREPD